MNTDQKLDLNPENSPQRQALIDTLLWGAEATVDVLINDWEAHLIMSCRTEHERDLAYVLIADNWQAMADWPTQVDYTTLLYDLWTERPTTQDEFSTLYENHIILLDNGK